MIAEAYKKARAFIFGRQQAYKSTFKGPVANEVLADLAQFCRAGKTAWHPDPRVHAMLQGRQEVWLRIQQHLNLPATTLWDLVSTPKGPEGE